MPEQRAHGCEWRLLRVPLLRHPLLRPVARADVLPRLPRMMDRPEPFPRVAINTLHRFAKCRSERSATQDPVSPIWQSLRQIRSSRRSGTLPARPRIPAGVHIIAHTSTALRQCSGEKATLPVASFYSASLWARQRTEVEQWNIHFTNRRKTLSYILWCMLQHQDAHCC